MKGFLALAGVDGNARAVRAQDIRLMQDDDVSEGAAPRVMVTLVDGTTVAVQGDVAGLLKLIEQLEP